jgi:hypothetical protein
LYHLLEKKIEYFLYCKIYIHIKIKTNMNTNTKTIVKIMDSYCYTNDTTSITGESMINYNNGDLIVVTGGNVHQR